MNRDHEKIHSIPADLTDNGNERALEAAKLHAMGTARRWSGPPLRPGAAPQPKILELRPNKRSGWRHDKRREFGFASQLNAEHYSVWTRHGIFLVSTLEIADYPDGSGEVGPQWHLSLSKSGPGWHPERCSDQECRQALACFGIAGAEEDNHEHGYARHFWMPVDPKRRVSCECKATEIQVVEPDGHRWSAPRDPSECNGCKMTPITGRVCSVHGIAP